MEPRRVLQLWVLQKHPHGSKHNCWVSTPGSTRTFPRVHLEPFDILELPLFSGFYGEPGWFSGLIPAGLLLMVPAEANEALIWWNSPLLQQDWEGIPGGELEQEPSGTCRSTRDASTDTSAGLRTILKLFRMTLKPRRTTECLCLRLND